MAASSAIKPGINSAAYRNTGSYGTPTWTEGTLVRDATVNAAWNLADASSRASRAVLEAKTQVPLKIQIVVRADDADAFYVALWAAAMSPTSLVDLMVLDGDIATEGAMGFRAEWNVVLSSQPQGAGDVVYTTFDLSPGWSSNGVPKSVIMGAASSPSFTSF